MSPQNCSIRPALKVIGGKWKPILLYHLMQGKKRNGELRRLLPEASQKVLTQQLRELERDGVVARTVHSDVPLKVEYALTDFGETLRPVMRALCEWGESLTAIK